MPESLGGFAALSRRDVLKVGLLGGAFLGTASLAASLSGCTPAGPASGYQVLRSGDLPFLLATVPVMLEGSVASGQLPTAVNATIERLDAGLARVSPAMLELTQQLFDVLALPLTRGPLTGVWGSWEHASAADINAFLSRWEHSSLSLLRMGHSALLQLVMMAWYSGEESWGHCGYPGPPTV